MFCGWSRSTPGVWCLGLPQCHISFNLKKHYGIISETSLRNNPISFFCFTSFWQRFPPPLMILHCLRTTVVHGTFVLKYMSLHSDKILRTDIHPQIHGTTVAHAHYQCYLKGGEGEGIHRRAIWPGRHISYKGNDLCTVEWSRK